MSFLEYFLQEYQGKIDWQKDVTIVEMQSGSFKHDAYVFNNLEVIEMLRVREAYESRRV